MASKGLTLAGAHAAFLLLAAPAWAIDPGVNYDPGSPAGKEFAIPIVEGRSEGAGTTNQRRAANIPFGIGIKPPGEGGGRDRGRRGENDLAELRGRIAEAENGGGAAGWTVAIVLSLLLLGLLLAFVLRRPHGQPA